MKKKWITSLFVCIAVCTMAAAFAACGHEHTLKKTERVEADCSAAGNSEYYTCTECGKYFSDKAATKEIQENDWVVSATGHIAVSVSATAAGCTDGNVAHYVCGSCGKHFSDSEATQEMEDGSWILPATGHTVVRTEAVAASCEAAGNSEYYTCKDCGKYFSDNAATQEIKKDSWVLPVTEHAAVLIESSEPSCFQTGNTAYYACEDCGKYFSDGAATQEIKENSWVLPVTEHIVVRTESVAAGCDTEGNSEYYTCVICGKYFSGSEATQEIEEDSWVYAPIGHLPVKTAGVAGSCVVPGNTAYYTCEICRRYFSDRAATQEIEEDSWILPAPGHDLSKTDATEASCTAAGNTVYYTCGNCGKYYSDRAAKNEIAKGSWIVPPAGGHDVTKTPATASTCGKAGNSEYYTCKGCGKYFSDSAATQEIAKNSWLLPTGSHDYVASEWFDAERHYPKTLTCSRDASHTLTRETIEISTADGLMTVNTDINAKKNLGCYTFDITEDIDMSGKTWVPLYLSGYGGVYGNVDFVFRGNGHTISHLATDENNPSNGGFVGYMWSSVTLTITDLTLSKASIYGDKNDVYDNQTNAVGAFVGYGNAIEKIDIRRCNVLDSHIEGGHWTGGLIGWVAGYSKQNDGPVDTYVTLSDCTVSGCEIVGKGSVGGAAGHCAGDAATFITMEKLSITDNTVTSTGSSTNKAGSVLGTANQGQTDVNECTVTGNTVSSGGASNEKIYGRLAYVNASDYLKVDGVKQE